ncbi:hypothetical protein BBF96_11250 [Anoxybacter fermentans]|uniref:O-antigen ligase-related domain-containing protein n=1 Tax=Anoxybacter fermentans TaxID=1323375 RepID=A0A3Q9HRX7_9FIRM|nr:O-antigen ligase family protein [Anoxybacter fermentans]AZR73916.1 hypothetical protein BBF96_11250 [Anoxybacter fermentans]
MKKNWIERFTGLTLAINPVFTLVGLIYLSARRTRGLIAKIKSDKANLYFWLFLAVSGIISIVFSINKSVAISSYFIPFVFIWLYILGRWVIQDPETFVQDLIRGVMILSIIAIIAKIFNLELSIGQVRILDKFGPRERGEILYVADNSLGLLFQVGVVGALGSLLIYWKEKKYVIENVITFIVSICGLIISASRGAMVGTLVAVLYLVVRYSFKALLGAGSIVGILAYFSRHRFFSAFDVKAHSVRIKIWLSSLEIIKDHPFFGVGPGNFGQIYDKYKPASLTKEVTCAHSNYLNIFIGWGIIGGLLFWGWQLFIFIRAALKGLTPLQRVIIAILISFYVHVMVNELFAAYSGFLLGLVDHPSFGKQENFSQQETFKRS